MIETLKELKSGSNQIARSAAAAMDSPAVHNESPKCELSGL
jgi:hypothetical protein